jgi:hypothetical protein
LGGVVHWSWDKNTAEAHWGSYSKGHKKWLMHAKVSVKDIDWPATLAANSHPSYEDEREITLREDVPVKLISYECRALR